MSQYDVIVIGSGMSGLSSAILAAREGKRVLVCEQHSRFGGYLQRYILDGTPFDAGCHYVGALSDGDIFDRYLSDLGVRDQIVAKPLDRDAYDVVHLGRLTVPLATGHTRCATQLGDLFPAQRDALRRFYTAIEREVACFPMYTLRPAADPAGSSKTGLSLSQVFDACGVTDGQLRRVLAAANLLYFVSPDECPFQLHAFVVDSYLRGAYHVEGGGHSLVKALVRRLRSLGGMTRRNCTITDITVTDRMVTGVKTADGEYLRAPVVIGAIDPKRIAAMLPEGAVRPVWRRRIARLKPGLGGLVVNARVDADLSRFAGGNHFVTGSDGTEPLFGNWLDADDPPVWLTVPSTREPQWKGPHSVIAITGIDTTTFAAFQTSTTGHRSHAYKRLKNRALMKVMSRLSGVLPELGNAISYHVATPLTHRDYTGNSSGAAYGLHHSLDQVGARGAGIRTRVNGLLLTGHSVLYPGILGATISAYYTCGELFGLKTLHERLCSDAARK